MPLWPTVRDRGPAVPRGSAGIAARRRVSLRPLPSTRRHPMSAAPVISAQDIVKIFPVRGDSGEKLLLRAVNRVSFDIGDGETLGLVGESGSGKSTIGRLLVGLIPVTSGSITLFGERIDGKEGEKHLSSVRRRIQFVFQDPYGSLNPRMRVDDCIAEPL